MCARVTSGRAQLQQYCWSIHSGLLKSTLSIVHMLASLRITVALTDYFLCPVSCLTRAATHFPLTLSTTAKCVFSSYSSHTVVIDCSVLADISVHIATKPQPLKMQDIWQVLFVYPTLKDVIEPTSCLRIAWGPPVGRE